MCTQPLRFPLNAKLSVSESARELLLAMLIKEPDGRPTLDMIAKDTWVTHGGAEPAVQVPSTMDPLRATPEEIHRAISLRSPGLNLAPSSHYGSASTRGTSTLTEAHAVQGSRTLLRTKSEQLRSQASLDFPFLPPR